MKLYGVPLRLECGVKEFFAFHGWKEDEGPQVRIQPMQEPGLRIEKKGDAVLLLLGREHLLFRALTLIAQRASEEAFECAEIPSMDTLGAMFDGSQASSLMNNASCKRMMCMLAGMGFNQMMLYCEDCYEVPGEPYWGNMRPRFSMQDFRELDAYAAALGIELVPCIQTLGHLKEAIKRPPYAAVADTSSVLLAGEEETYRLIDRLIGTMAECFTSRRIHLGLDEAWDLGLGKYLKKNGYHPQDEIMLAHLNRVYEIARRHGFTPMMWADMFFRARSKTGGYYDLDVQFTQADRAAVPEGMQLIYWDYYHETQEEYETMIRRYRELSDNPVVFAGCSRNVRTFGSHYQKTVNTTAPALAACKKMGVREAFATVWGDDHRESSTFATLRGLCFFAEQIFGTEPTQAEVAKRVEACTGLPYEAFGHIDSLDAVPGFNGDNPGNLSVTRAVIWQDPLLGLLDGDLGDFDFAPHYAALTKRLAQDAAMYPAWRTLFEYYAAVAAVAELKSGLGRGLYAAYQKGDRAELSRLAKDVLPELQRRMRALWQAHRLSFFEEYRPVGWEVLDIRYGGAMARLDTTAMRLADYLEGRVESIAELEEARLSFSGTGALRQGLNYQQIASASTL